MFTRHLCSDIGNAGLCVRPGGLARAGLGFGPYFQEKARAREGQAGPGLRNGRGAGRVTGRPSHKPVVTRNEPCSKDALASGGNLPSFHSSFIGPQSPMCYHSARNVRKKKAMMAATLLLLIFVFIVQAKVDIRQTTANKAFMETVRDGFYEVVHPFQIRDKNERIGIDTRNYFLKAREHFEHVTIVIRSNSLGRLKLVLDRNDYIFVNQTSFRKLDSDGEKVVHPRVENCYYQGTVGGEESSFVALSSCNGLRGVISFANGTTYGVWPLDTNDRGGKRHPHVLYKTDWKKDARCGTSLAQSVESRIRRAAHKKRVHKLRNRDVSKRTKYVEVALIADHEFVKQQALTESDSITYMLEALNIADFMLSRDLNIRLSAVYVELWMDAQRIDLFEDSQRTLSGVVEYIAGHIYHIQKDATILFTSGSFANSEAGSAEFRNICTARSAVFVKAIDDFATQWTGELISQQVGHLLGLEHDTAACSCEPSSQCVMRSRPGYVGSPFAWQFSKCSVARMHGIWQDGHVQCLLNKPFQGSELTECGNGVVDASEECDCGSRESCSDPCCDPLTCTLKAHAQCAAHHKCCNRCQLRKAGEVCRASRSSCDVTEMCDGSSGECPPDGHLIDGTVCGQDGQCWRGNCSEPHSQCVSLWGEQTKVADVACFEQNSRGHEFASCGQSGDGSFRPCRREDVQCGTLHCQGGEVAPRDAAFKAFTFHFSQNQQQIQCKSIAHAVEGMVMNGANCGSGRVCIDGSCVEMSSVSAAVACPTNNLALLCSGHGHCTTTQQCVCFSGWSGKACDMRSNTSSIAGSTSENSKNKISIIPTLSITTTLETATLLAILLVVGMILLLILVCLMFCYRRKSVVEIPIANDEKNDDDQPERSIKFGNMPSYREEKRKRKSSKRIYGALNRITEADERDSNSMRSRDSVCQQENQLLFDPRNRGEIFEETVADNIYAESLSSLSNRHIQDCFRDGEGYPLRTFGSWRSSAPMSPSSSNGHCASAPLRLNKIGQILRNLPPDEDYPENIVGHRNDLLLAEEELSAVEADRDFGSNTESSRGDDIDMHERIASQKSHSSWDQQPPSSNNPNEDLNFRESPSLFSDPFRLELSSSIHT
ncbi:unnamed protein product [Caenorhabditis auriculariae]|uniref:Uncharacterized protein n=1 Tax=Caenorhabditis auriculariae TaxID=2777116 RepID=A0A8S1GXN0_9PELO|nr:unnamed protein product [Caenorhabditis auriculariae]